MSVMANKFVVAGTFLATLLLAPAVAHAQYDRHGGYNDGPVRCESIKNRTQQCRIDGRPRLVRQLSKTRCVEGQNWGHARGGVWVSNGCRAEFIAEGGRGHGNGHGNGPGWGQGGGRGEIVECHSNDHKAKYCDARIRRDVRLVRQQSKAACIEGRSWGWDRRGLWVSNGCRAQFSVN